jgi:flagellar motor switch protein FliN/FliY
VAQIEEVARFADVPMSIEVEIGRPQLRLRDILGLHEGSVVTLSRAAGENIDIRVSGVLIGFGEIIVSENGVGVRITDFKGEE